MNTLPNKRARLVLDKYTCEALCVAVAIKMCASGVLEAL